MRPRLRSFLKLLACLVGLHRLSRRLHRHRLLICCYHGLRADEDPRRHWLLLPQREFARQIRYLRSHYRCIPIDQAVEELSSGRLIANTACVTFDDGYQSNLNIGLPLLQQYEIPATIYLTTGLVGTNGLLWNTELELAIRGTRSTAIDLDELDLGTRRLEDLEGRREVARVVSEALKQRPYSERQRLLDKIHTTLDAPMDSSARESFALLTWAEVQRMEATGLVRFGGHTRYHDILSRLEDVAVKTEVARSIGDVSARLAMPSRTFAYPNGTPSDFDERSSAAVQEEGGTAAVTTIGGLCEPGDDLYSLRRVVVGSEMTFSEFRLHTAGVPGLWARVSALWRQVARRISMSKPVPGQ